MNYPGLGYPCSPTCGSICISRNSDLIAMPHLLLKFGTFPNYYNSYYINQKLKRVNMKLWLWVENECSLCCRWILNLKRDVFLQVQLSWAFLLIITQNSVPVHLSLSPVQHLWIKSVFTARYRICFQLMCTSLVDHFTTFLKLHWTKRYCKLIPKKSVPLAKSIPVNQTLWTTQHGNCTFLRMLHLYL